MIHQLGSAARAWLAERCLGHAAGIAFYTVLSLSPFLVLALAAASFLVDRGVAIAEVHAQLRGLVGAQGADLVADMIASANATHSSGVAAAIALAATLFGATAAIAQLKFALDELFCARDARTSVRQAVRVRLIGVAAALVLGVLVVASLIASALARMAIASLGLASAFGHRALLTVNEVLALAVVIAAFYGLLRFLPSEPLPRGATWRGALAAGVLFEVAKFGIGVYLRHATSIKAYGAAGALVVLMLWVYYVTAMLLYGALVGRAYRGAPVAPAPVGGPNYRGVA
ncbi:MAG: YihY/virulence factor BrkB family protein [Burkholderiales bacterium]|jgi:membrane protein